MQTPDGLPPMSADLNLASEAQFNRIEPDSFVRPPGLPGMEVRNIGFGELGGGKVAAQIFRACDGWSALSLVWHMHDLDLQIGYVISGWLRYEMEGLGEVLVEAGTAIYHIPRNRFRILDRSSDFEGIWFKVPATDVVTAFVPDGTGGELKMVEFRQTIK